MATGNGGNVEASHGRETREMAEASGRCSTNHRGSGAANLPVDINHVLWGHARTLCSRHFTSTPKEKKRKESKWRPSEKGQKAWPGTRPMICAISLLMELSMSGLVRVKGSGLCGMSHQTGYILKESRHIRCPPNCFGPAKSLGGKDIHRGVEAPSFDIEAVGEVVPSAPGASFIRKAIGYRLGQAKARFKRWP